MLEVIGIQLHGGHGGFHGRGFHHGGGFHRGCCWGGAFLGGDFVGSALAYPYYPYPYYPYPYYAYPYSYPVYSEPIYQPQTQLSVAPSVPPEACYATERRTSPGLHPAACSLCRAERFFPT